MEAAQRDHSIFGAERTSACVRAAYGTACEVEHEDRTIRVDLPSEAGGSSTGPHPAQLMRASLGASALAAIRTEATRRGLPVHTLTLEITCESRGASELECVPGAPPWKRVGIIVRFESGGSEGDLAACVEQALRQSPMFALLSAEVERTVEVRRASAVP